MTDLHELIFRLRELANKKKGRELKALSRGWLSRLRKVLGKLNR